MESGEIWKSKSSDEIEEWFLSAISEDNLEFKKVAGLLHYLIKADELAQFKGLAELLQEDLKEREMKKEGIWLLTLRCTVFGEDPSFKRIAMKAADAILDSRLGSMCVKNSGFDTNLPVTICMQRLNLLLTLKKGSYCHEKTWGFGVVKRVDDFYEKVTVDFKTKPGHQFSFKYAAETLELVGDDHLMARHHSDPDAFAALVKSNPEDVIKIALESYGPMSVPLLNELFVENGLIEESGWKSFWAAARRKLKTDALVEIPEKRNDPVVLLESERSYDEKWFDALSKQRDVGQILLLVRELLENVSLDEMSDEAKGVVEGRLKFVMTAGTTVDRSDVVAALLLAREMKLPEENTGAQEFVEKLKSPNVFSGIVNTLTLKQASEFREYLSELYPEEISNILIGSLRKLQGPILNDAMGYLVENNLEECTQTVKGYLDLGDVSAHMIQWLCKNSKEVVGWGVATPFSIMMILLDGVGRRGVDVTLAETNQLKGLLEKGPWFLETMDKLTEEQRSDVVIRIKRSNDWDESGRRAVMARAVKAFPHLQSIFVQSSEPEDDGPRGNFTSERSYRERNEQLNKLVNEDIPKNSKAIGVARSYGDLRENAEYDAARHEQALLMKRKAELESDLTRVTATDFNGFPVDKAGIGTHVVIKRDDGVDMTFNILGEWDRDESLNIISSKSRMAELLAGAKPGDELILPTEDGEKACVVESVRGLDDEVIAWVAGNG